MIVPCHSLSDIEHRSINILNLINQVTDQHLLVRAFTYISNGLNSEHATSLEEIDQREEILSDQASGYLYPYHYSLHVLHS